MSLLESHYIFYISKPCLKKHIISRKNIGFHLEGFSMKSNPMISSTPRAFSCSTTFERLHLFISGTVESISLPNSLSGYNRKHFPGPSRPARPLHLTWTKSCYDKSDKSVIYKKTALTAVRNSVHQRHTNMQFNEMLTFNNNRKLKLLYWSLKSYCMYHE